MTLRPNISRAELSDYCELCHEHGIKFVKVDSKTLFWILQFREVLDFWGITFRDKNWRKHPNQRKEI